MNELRAEALSVRLAGRDVVDRVDLALRPGEITAIVGPNGAGKSTLLSVLAGLRTPSAGRAMLDGGPIGDMTARTRAQRIGYLPQTAEIAWPLDVQTFVRLGRTAHRGLFGETAADRRAVDGALASTGVTALVDREVTSLSGGERALVLIARALAAEPAWLLADEPLTGLDVGHQIDVAALLRRVATGGTGVVVTVHDLAFAARTADRIVVMSRGRLAADDVALRALTPTILAHVYGVEARWTEGAGGGLLDVLRRLPPG